MRTWMRKCLSLNGGVLDSLRRLRGRLGRNLPASVTLLLSGVCAGVTDRPHIPHALLTLLARRRLIPVDSKEEVSKKPPSRVEKSREE